MTTLTCPWGGGRRWGRNSWQQETQVWASGKYYKTRPSTLHLNLLFHDSMSIELGQKRIAKCP